MSWHLSPAHVRAYAAGGCDPGLAWSAETHLTGCPRCRERLTAALSTEDVALLARVRDELVLEPVQRRRWSWPSVTRGVLGPWWAWLGVLVIGVLLVRATAWFPLRLDPATAGLSWAAALSSLVPVVLVAVVYAVADDDPVTSTTPRGGLELLLVRTAAVLALAVPVTSAALWWTVPEQAALVGWLLPGLGLCLGALALGSWVGVERAAAGLAVAWAVAVVSALSPAPLPSPVWLLRPAPSWTAAWLVVLAGCCLVIALRWRSYDAPTRGLRLWRAAG